MFKNRLFNILMVAALVVLTALTIQQALETTKVVLAADMYGLNAHPEDTSFCAMLVDRSSIHSVFIEEMGLWVSRTDSGPTGVDGGLLELLSNYRSCSIGKEK